MTAAWDFETERAFLVRLAYRMLGSVADAEDVVQEAWLRWRQAGEPDLDAPRAWFARTATRLCLDRLKSARHQREQYAGVWLPEPLVGATDERHELDDTLSVALMATVERLRPAERAAFLLHDVFDYSFTEVADILELQPANCRQLASRARRHLALDKARRPADEATVRRLSDAFFAALDAGDLSGLRGVLAEDVVLRSDGGGKVAAAPRPIEGRQAVLRFLRGIFVAPRLRPAVHPEPVWFNGAPGVLLREDGEPVSAFQFRVEDGAIVRIDIQRNPDKLGGF